MLAHLTMLRYWKSEHTEETCEDAYGENTVQGLFAVADGAGTTLFSDAWAAFLVKHFLLVPLLSNDPFEVEWWVRQAQEQFKQEFSIAQNMPWNAVQKLQEQGSHSTLVTLRVVKADNAHATTSLLVFGDSCVIAYRPTTEQFFSFPLTETAEFEQAPICVPSKSSVFNRHFHRCHVTSLELSVDDVVLLATDAVSKWIISAGSGRYPKQSNAFLEVMQQTPETWPAFIQQCRANKEMVDDDSTALILALKGDVVAAPFMAPVVHVVNVGEDSIPNGGRDTSGPYDNALSLGVTTEHDKRVREKRINDFASAIKDQNKDRMALFIGDGADLALEDVRVPPEFILQARAVADAQSKVLNVLRRELNNPSVIAIMTPIWQRYAQLLYNEPCAENLRNTLTRLGVPLEPVASPPLEEQKLVEQEQPSPVDEIADDDETFKAQMITFTEEQAALIAQIKGVGQEET